MRAQRLRTRRRRDSKGQVFVEGARSLAPALSSGRLREVFVTSGGERRREGFLAEVRSAGLPVREISEEVMAALTSTSSTPDIAGIATVVLGGTEILRDGPWPAMLLRGFRDPAAAGTALATAAAFGARASMQGATTVDLAGPKVVRAAAGAHFQMRLGRSVSDDGTLETARDAGAQIVTLHPDGAPLYEAALPDAMMLVVQGSGERISGGLPVWVPSDAMLPATQMVAMAWYEWRRQRS